MFSRTTAVSATDNTMLEQPIKIAVLITCYNRKQKTIDCLAALFHQAYLQQVELHVYLTDDGSTDGTSEAVQEFYPQVKVIQGNGSLFWTGGMQLAFSEAIQHDYDYHLWLNDDTTLYPHALTTLLNTFWGLKQQGHSKAIVVGATQDPETGEFTYGGVNRGTWLHPCRFRVVRPGDEPKPCDTMSGNCVLISRAVIEIMGGVDPTFRHYAADYDYGLRSRRQQCFTWLAPGYLGSCFNNPRPSRTQKTYLTAHEQWQKLEQPKGIVTSEVTLHPFWEWKEFTKRHAGLFWPIYWLLPYRRLLWSS